MSTSLKIQCCVIVAQERNYVGLNHEGTKRVFCTLSLEVAAGNEFRGSGGAVNHFSAAALEASQPQR